MAYIVERPRADGNGETTYQVRWREGGGRGAPGQSETFADMVAAKQFRDLVDAHGQRWPHGWIPGRGFVEPEAESGDVPFMVWARRYVDRLTGIDERTRADYDRDVRLHLSLLRHTRFDGVVEPATIANITPDDIADWVRVQETGKRDPDDLAVWLRRPAAPKSIANRHGLLWCIVQAAVEAEPPLRVKNCCKGTRLPRLDDEIEEKMYFLEREEYQLLVSKIADPRARDLVDWLVSTGMRWGEATAIQCRDVSLERATVSVQRAWKRLADNTYALGPPKTRKARRHLALAPAQVEMTRRLMAGQPPHALLFRTPQGKMWRYSNFYHRKWKPGVDGAVEESLPRRPRIHDLRHTHAAWLIAANIPLPAIQARLGHESIQTTVGRYGGLVRELDREVAAAVEAAMAAPGGTGRGGFTSAGDLRPQRGCTRPSQPRHDRPDCRRRA